MVVFSKVKFGKEVSAEIRRRNLTFREASQEMYVDIATLHRTASGKQPSLTTYLRIAEWLRWSRLEKSAAELRK